MAAQIREPEPSRRMEPKSTEPTVQTPETSIVLTAMSCCATSATSTEMVCSYRACRRQSLTCSVLSCEVRRMLALSYGAPRCTSKAIPFCWECSFFGVGACSLVHMRTSQRLAPTTTATSRCQSPTVNNEKNGFRARVSFCRPSVSFIRLSSTSFNLLQSPSTFSSPLLSPPSFC